MNATLSRGQLAIFWLSFVLYVATLPVANVIALRNLSFVLFIGATIYAAVRRNVTLTLPLTLPWLAYAAIAGVSLTYAVDRPYSMRYAVSEVGFGILVFAAAHTWSRRMNVLDGLIAIIVSLNAAALFTLVTQYPQSEIWNVVDLHRERIGLPLARVALNSNFLISVMPMIAYGAWRLHGVGRHRLAAMLGLLLATDVVALLASGNRQNMLALAASMLCVLPFLPHTAFTRGRVVAFAILAAVVGALFFLQLTRRLGTVTDWATIAMTIHVDPRWDLWRFSIERILENPWQGGGFGRGVFDKLYAYYRPEDANLWHAHNMFLNKGIQMGIPGMVVFAWLWVALLRKLASIRLQPPPVHAVAMTGISIAVGVLIKNISDDFFFRDPALLFWVQMGVVLGTATRFGESA